MNQFPEGQIRFILAEKRHEEFLYELKNDPSSVRWSKSQKGVSENEHSRWFERALRDHEITIVICEISDHEAGIFEPIFYARFHKSCTQLWELSVALKAEYRARGLSGFLLSGAISFFLQSHSEPDLVLKALVRPENAASSKLFESIGFRREGMRKELLTYTRVVNKSFSPEFE